jgi:hypothetical protein
MLNEQFWNSASEAFATTFNDLMSFDTMKPHPKTTLTFPSLNSL